MSMLREWALLKTVNIMLRFVFLIYLILGAQYDFVPVLSVLFSFGVYIHECFMSI